MAPKTTIRAAGVQHPGAAGGQHAACVVGDGVVQALQAEGARAAVGPDDQPPSHPVVRAGDAGDDGDRLVPRDRLGHLAEPGEGLPRHRLDEDVEDPAAGQPDGEGVVVADAVPLEGRDAGLDDVLGLLVDRTLDAAAGDAAHSGAVGADEHRRAGRAGGRPPGGHHSAHADGLTRLPPADQVLEHVTHPTAPLLGVEPWWPRPEARPELAKGERDGVLFQAREMTPASSWNAARLCPATKWSTDGSAACIPPVSGW